MPQRDERTRANTRAGKHQTSGRMNVLYRDAKGNTVSATVLSQGTASGLKLQLGSRMGMGGTDVIDNVAAATGAKQTGVYFTRERIQ